MNESEWPPIVVLFGAVVVIAVVLQAGCPRVYNHTPEPPQTRWTIPSLDERGVIVRFDADPPGDNAPVLTVYPEQLPADALICVGAMGCKLVREFYPPTK